MEPCFCNCLAKEDLQGVYKTILMFLEIQNFKETAKTFQQECTSLGLSVNAAKQNIPFSGTETLESALQQVMTTLKKIEYTIVQGQKDIDISKILEDIAEKLKTTQKIQVLDDNSKVVNVCLLDFAKIKYDLIHNTIDVQLQLLSAFRWIIINYDIETRNQFINSLIQNDILQLKTMDQNLVGYFLKNTDIDWLQEGMSRFVNTIASLKAGRDYLTSNDTFIQVILFPNILRQSISNICQNMLIASLQKLSLRSSSRHLMLRLGLLEFIVDFLEESDDATPRYSLDYSSALLMNLCLESEGRERCAQMPKKIIHLLRKLLSGEVACCLPCVNGTLYSILVNKQINNEAKIQKMDQLLLYIAKTAEDESIKKQMNIILWSRFHGEIEPLSDEISQHELENEEEFLENELDEGNTLTKQNIGTILQKYILEPRKEEAQLNWLCRPVTPASFKTKSNCNNVSPISVQAFINQSNEDDNFADSEDMAMNDSNYYEFETQDYSNQQTARLPLNYELETTSCPSERRVLSEKPKKSQKRFAKPAEKSMTSRKCLSDAEYYPKPYCSKSICCRCIKCSSFAVKLKRKIDKLNLQ